MRPATSQRRTTGRNAHPWKRGNSVRPNVARNITMAVLRLTGKSETAWMATYMAGTCVRRSALRKLSLPLLPLLPLLPFRVGGRSGRVQLTQLRSEHLEPALLLGGAAEERHVEQSMDLLHQPPAVSPASSASPSPSPSPPAAARAQRL